MKKRMLFALMVSTLFSAIATATPTTDIIRTTDGDLDAYGTPYMPMTSP